MSDYLLKLHVEKPGTTYTDPLTGKQSESSQGQIDKLDGFIGNWANTADLKSLKARADALTGSCVKSQNGAALIMGVAAS